MTYAVSRSLGFDAGAAAGLLAGGLNASAAIGTAADAVAKLPIDEEARQALATHVTVAFAVTYGEGIASYMNDGGMDLAPETTPGSAVAKAVPLLGISAYLDHTWNDRFTSSFGYSRTSVDNTTGQLADAFATGQYASANLLYYPTKNVFIGGEALWGQREDNNGATGDDFRIQTTFHCSFSTKDIFKKN